MTELVNNGAQMAALRRAVEQDNRRAASMREHSRPQACVREVEEELVDVRADGGKQVPFRVVDAPLEFPVARA
jgi:hypothetical protein